MTLPIIPEPDDQFMTRFRLNLEQGERYNANAMLWSVRTMSDQEKAATLRTAVRECLRTQIDPVVQSGKPLLPLSRYFIRFPFLWEAFSQALSGEEKAALHREIVQDGACGSVTAFRGDERS